jgi:predicted phage tail protein
VDFTGASTAIMLAAAAVLWFLYLMPTWFRRRQYLATERNATRLQRTIRIMAETAEVPEAVRVEANAREVAQRERLLRQEERRVAAAARLKTQSAIVHARPAAAAESLTRLRMRRARRLATLLTMTGLAAGSLQVWLMVTTGAVFGSWLVLAASGASFVLGSRMQGMLNRRASLLRVAATPRRATAWRDQSLEADADVRGWTPVPIPKPLYLERAEPPRVAASTVDADALMRAAAAEAERALRAAHAEPEVVAFPRSAPAPAPAAAPSRYAQMGIVDPGASHAIDLDEALRRRRA